MRLLVAYPASCGNSRCPLGWDIGQESSRDHGKSEDSIALDARSPAGGDLISKLAALPAERLLLGSEFSDRSVAVGSRDPYRMRWNRTLIDG